MKQIANANFYPERPLLIGPIIQNPEEFSGFTETTRHRLETLDQKTGKKITSEGEFTVSVIADQRELTVDGGDFEHVLHWKIEASGFSGIPKSQGLLFTKWEWYWNTRPIMIPKIVIVGEISDFLSGNGSDASALVGEITIDLSAKHYDM
jgi:hypothetical protein